jgi:hypothetical protein
VLVGGNPRDLEFELILGVLILLISSSLKLFSEYFVRNQVSSLSVLPSNYLELTKILQFS